MKRTFDVFATQKWRKSVSVKVAARVNAGIHARCQTWIDKFDSNGECYAHSMFVDAHDRACRVYVFTDEADAIMFKLKFGGE